MAMCFVRLDIPNELDEPGFDDALDASAAAGAAARVMSGVHAGSPPILIEAADEINCVARHGGRRAIHALVLERTPTPGMNRG